MKLPRLLHQIQICHSKYPYMKKNVQKRNDTNLSTSHQIQGMDSSKTSEFPKPNQFKFAMVDMEKMCNLCLIKTIEIIEKRRKSISGLFRSSYHPTPMISHSKFQGFSFSRLHGRIKQIEFWAPSEICKSSDAVASLWRRRIYPVSCRNL